MKQPTNVVSATPDFIMGWKGGQPVLVRPLDVEGPGGMSAYLPPVVDVTRNSANDATDATDVIMATFSIPIGAPRIGSIIETWALFNNTNSAITKSFSIFINGTSAASATNTTNLSLGFRMPHHVHDATTLVALNNASAGSGAAGGALLSQTVSALLTAPLTITIRAKWSAATLAESITLRHAKINIIY